MRAEVHAAHIIRAYTWRLLRNNQPNDWKPDNYGGKTPLVALSEEPDISDYSQPYIVYGYAYDGTGDLHARKSGSVTFAVYDNDNRRLGRTMNTLITAFERQDEAAKDVNRWSTANNFLGLRFGYISIGFVESGTPEETEGGMQSALVSLRFECYVKYDVVTDSRQWTV